jgi:RNA recognition motif-containing protein
LESCQIDHQSTLGYHNTIRQKVIKKYLLLPKRNIYRKIHSASLKERQIYTIDTISKVTFAFVSWLWITFTLFISFLFHTMSKKLFIGNIAWTASDEDLKALFSQHGEVEEAIIITDRFSGRSKGFGFVTFVNDADALSALEALNGHDLNGREINVSEARPQEDR